MAEYDWEVAVVGIAHLFADIFGLVQFPALPFT